MPSTSRSPEECAARCPSSTDSSPAIISGVSRSWRRCSPASKGGTRREGDPARGRALARGRREGRGRDGRRNASLGAEAAGREPRDLRIGEDVRLRLRRLRRERRLRERTGGVRDRGAEVPLLRHRRRARLQRRPALRGRDRRVRRARRMKLVERLADLNESGERGVLFTVVEGDGVGSKLLVLESGERVGEGLEEAAAQFDELIRRGRNQVLTLDDGTKVFAEWYGPPPRLFVYGAVDTAEALCRGAKLLGWHAIVADARGKFATPERIPSADELIVEWPAEAMAQVEPDHQTAIVVLTHDDKFDEPALAGALETEAFYIGALGSRRNQERPRGRPLEAGLSPGALGRLPQGREAAHPRRSRVAGRDRHGRRRPAHALTHAWIRSRDRVHGLIF